MNKRDISFLIILMIFIIIYVIINVHNLNNADKVNTIIVPDTIYDRTIIDCTKINIIKHDSIIYNIKYETKENIKEVINFNDTATILLFQELVAD